MWYRLTHLGVDAATDLNDVKYIVLTNGLALVVLVLASLLAVINAPIMVQAGEPSLLVIFLTTIPACILCLLLNRRKNYGWAVLLFGLATGGQILAMRLLTGPEVGLQYLLLAYAVAPFALYAPRYKMVMLSFAPFSMAMFLLGLYGLPDAPVLQIDAATVRTLAIANSVALFVILTSFALFIRYNSIAAETKLNLERERSENLLLNILPAPTAERLKNDERAIADGFQQVTVLFADIAGFTVLSSTLSPEAIVQMLNDVFTEFDHLAEKYGLEKIKTIGDAYMAACGVPLPNPAHAATAAAMALEMVEVVNRVQLPTGGKLSIRIGINTGPVVAGVIGRKKFIYDLWGDTVNTASRMESHGTPDHIQLTQATVAQLGPEFIVEERGVVEIKGKGPMQTWWLRGRRVG